MSKQSGAPVRIAVVDPGSMVFLPVVLAEALGYFREQGLSVRIDAVSGGTRSMQAVLGNSAEVAVSLFDQLILMAAESRGVRSFLLFERCPLQVLAASPAVPRPAQRIADLKGATIGVTTPGAPIHLQLSYLLHRHGLSPADVSVVGLGSNAARVAALTSGKVDAAVLGEPGATVLQRRHPGLTLLADTRTPVGTREAFGSEVYPGGVLFASEQWLRTNANSARTVASAVIQAIRWLRQTAPRDVARRVPRQYRIDNESAYAEALQRLIPVLAEDGLMPPEAPETVKRVLSAFDVKVRGANLDARQTYTNEFAGRA
jgi:NitT/TauT family transport system substrate-binding protein